MATFTEPFQVWWKAGGLVEIMRPQDQNTEHHFRVRNRDGTVVDLTSTTTTIHIEDPEGNRIVTAFGTTLTDATNGELKFVLTGTETTKLHPGGGDYVIKVLIDSGRPTNDLTLRVLHFTS